MPNPLCDPAAQAQHSVQDRQRDPSSAPSLGGSSSRLLQLPSMGWVPVGQPCRISESSKVDCQSSVSQYSGLGLIYQTPAMTPLWENYPPLPPLVTCVCQPHLHKQTHQQLRQVLPACLDFSRAASLLFAAQLATQTLTSFSTRGPGILDSGLSRCDGPFSLQTTTQDLGCGLGPLVGWRLRVTLLMLQVFLPPARPMPKQSQPKGPKSEQELGGQMTRTQRRAADPDSIPEETPLHAPFPIPHAPPSSNEQRRSVGW